MKIAPSTSNLASRARVAAVGHGQVEQLVAVGLQRVRHRLQQRAALGEGQRAQRGPALRAGELEGAGQVEPLAARLAPAAPRWPGSRASAARPLPSTQRPPRWLRSVSTLAHAEIPTWPSTNA